MQTFELNPEADVQDFMTGFLNPEKQDSPQNTSKEPDSVQNFLDQPTDETTEGPKPEVVADDKKVEEFVKEEQKAEEDKSLIKDVSKFVETFKEKGLLQPYEDGTLPSTEEEAIDALLQSHEYKAQVAIEEAWREKIESLSPNLQLIHEYAAQGVTTAQQLSQFTNSVAQTEAVAQLDPKSPEDQERIVLLQLMNTGLSEQDARDEVADLKERGRLESKATTFYPTLKRAYDDNVRQQLAEKAREEESVQSYVKNNAINTQYFLEKDTDYLPFKITPQDKNYKQAIYQLGAQVIERQEDGTPVFGWQKYIESLQFGDEASYKKYMKAMAYLANMDKYEEGISKKSANTAITNNFKKIKTTSGTQTNVTSEAESARKQIQKGPWSR
jgi:hypothetical protein